MVKTIKMIWTRTAQKVTNLKKKAMKMNLSLNLWKTKTKVKPIFSIKIIWAVKWILSKILVNYRVNQIKIMEVLKITDNYIKYIKKIKTDSINIKKKKCQKLTNKTMKCQERKLKWQRCRTMKELIQSEQRGNPFTKKRYSTDKMAKSSG